MNKIKIGMAQLNPVLGDFSYNYSKIIKMIDNAFKQGVDLLVFPELITTGYSPRDLLFKSSFIEGNIQCVKDVAAYIPEGIAVILGFVDSTSKGLHSAAALIHDKNVQAVRYKTLLPNYDVFDEVRYFKPAESNDPVSWKSKGGIDLSIGLEICEDLWDSDYRVKVTDELALKGVDILVNISASPFTDSKFEERAKLIQDKVEKLKIPFIYVNMVGAQDELVFDGNSIAFDSEGRIVGWGGEFCESLNVFDIESGLGNPVDIHPMDTDEKIYNALVLGVRDYLRKSQFSKAVIGLSGGIDSALVASITADAIGSENVLCVAMPSKYSSKASIDDARELTGSLNVKFRIIPIDEIVNSYENSLSEMFESLPEDITEENIQARVRGDLLMAISNKFNYIVLSTGNKTELALGYCTLYGDMTGGLAVISDVSKEMVYRLSRLINRKANKQLIPDSIIEKTPTAELKANQVDPFDYSVVSPLVDSIINEGKSQRELIDMGYEKSLVKDLLDRIQRAEYKRRQAPPGIKISEKAFGNGRRFPIINHFKENSDV